MRKYIIEQLFPVFKLIFFLLIVFLIGETLSRAWDEFKRLRQDYRIYANLDGEWQEIVKIRDVPQELCVSKSGTAWLATSNRDRLYRFNGNTTQFFTKSDIGTHPPENFIVVDETIWGVYEKDIMRFNGQQWQVWKNVLPEEIEYWATELAGDELSLWVFHENRTLTYFDGETASTTDLFKTLPVINPDWRKTEGVYSQTEIVFAPDDHLWLNDKQNVWRLHDGEWQQMSPPRLENEFERLQATPDGVWVKDRSTILWFWDGEQWLDETAVSPHLLPSTDMYKISADGQMIHANQFIYWQKDATWQTFDLPHKPGYWVHHRGLPALSGSGVWAVLEPEPGDPSFWVSFVQRLAFPAVIVLFWFAVATYERRQERKNLQSRRQNLTTPLTPDDSNLTERKALIWQGMIQTFFKYAFLPFTIPFVLILIMTMAIIIILPLALLIGELPDWLMWVVMIPVFGLGIFVLFKIHDRFF